MTEEEIKINVMRFKDKFDKANDFFKKRNVQIALVLILFAILGIYHSYKQNTRLTIPIYSLIIFFTVIHAALLAISRYSIPVMPYVIMFASVGIIKTYDKLKILYTIN